MIRAVAASMTTNNMTATANTAVVSVRW